MLPFWRELTTSSRMHQNRRQASVTIRERLCVKRQFFPASHRDFISRNLRQARQKGEATSISHDATILRCGYSARHRPSRVCAAMNSTHSLQDAKLSNTGFTPATTGSRSWIVPIDTLRRLLISVHRQIELFVFDGW